jgi:hypothetical protein
MLRRYMTDHKPESARGERFVTSGRWKKMHNAQHHEWLPAFQMPCEI